MATEDSYHTYHFFIPKRRYRTIYLILDPKCILTQILLVCPTKKSKKPCNIVENHGIQKVLLLRALLNVDAGGRIWGGLEV